MQLLDGRKVSQIIKDKIKASISEIKNQRTPKLVVIVVGDDYASILYVNNKVKACKEVGISTEVVTFKNDVLESDLIKKIAGLNQDSTVDGILIQLPLPKHLNAFKVLNTIKPEKDVDGLTSSNAGKLLLGDPISIIPCTVKGITTLLEYYNIKITNQDVVIINNSNIVGKPLAMILNNLGASVSILHKGTKDLTPYLKNADIICTATGKYNLFTEEQVKKDVIIIDIGINKIEGKKIVGDVNFEAMKLKAQAITPVPGGVGPMTIAMLLDNLMLIYNKSKK